MTDYQKLEQITDDAFPEFPTSRKGGYMEEKVDEFISQFFKDVQKVIEYQNQTVDAYEVKSTQLTERTVELEKVQVRLAETLAELEVAKAAAPAGESVDEEALEERIRAVYEQQFEAVSAEWSAREAALQSELDAARAEAPAALGEAAQATALLLAAERTANDYVDEAKAKADAIVSDAEGSIDNLHAEIINLEASRDALHDALVGFHTAALAQLEEVESVEDTVIVDSVVETPDSNEDAVDEEVPALDLDEVEEADDEVEDDEEVLAAVEDEDDVVAPAEADVTTESETPAEEAREDVEELPEPTIDEEDEDVLAPAEEEESAPVDDEDEEILLAEDEDDSPTTGDVDKK